MLPTPTATPKTVTCGKCAGSGYVSRAVSRGCAGDVCFACGGKGVTVVRKPRKEKAPREIVRRAGFKVQAISGGVAHAHRCFDTKQEAEAYIAPRLAWTPAWVRYEIVEGEYAEGMFS